MPKGYSAHNQRNGATVAERLRNRSHDEPNGCRVWDGAKALLYGVIGVNGRNVGTHRAAWEAVNGPIPAGLRVCHKCDNPPCINVDHLFLGTDADNVADKVEKGRHPRGEADTKAKLTEAQVRDIIASDRPVFELAGKYGVAPAHIYNIRRGEKWAHLGVRPVYEPRILKGDDHPRAKITAEQAVAIFNDRRPRAVVCKSHGITLAILKSIRRGRTWGHVTGAQLWSAA